MAEKIRTLLISPHSDDIAFSIGGALLSHFFPEPLIIATVFTRSISADYFDGPHDVRTISELRESEDREYAKRIGSRVLRLNYPEATYFRKTGRDLVPLNFFAYLLWGWGASPPHPPPERAARRLARRLVDPVPLVERSALLHALARVDRTHPILREHISSLLQRYRGATLVCPLGLGTHPNHVVLAEVCRSLRTDASAIFFYEDLPYASAYDVRQIRRFVRIFDAELSPTLIPIDDVIDEKIENSLLYYSQVRRKDMDRVLRYARTLSHRGLFERVWTYPCGRRTTAVPSRS